MSLSIHPFAIEDDDIEGRFESSGDFYVGFYLAGEQIDKFLYGLKEIVEGNPILIRHRILDSTSWTAGPNE